jgi:RimJ/RimL family protein N-acetyltransferase
VPTLTYLNHGGRVPITIADDFPNGRRASTVSPVNWREGLPLLVSANVVLRELRRADAAALWLVARTPGVGRYSWPAPPTVDAFDSFITQAWRDRTEGKYACFAFVPREQAEPAGVFELRSLQPHFVRAELGMMLAPVVWDDAAFVDGMRVICEFAFNTVGVHRIEIRTPVAHAQCNAALERLGVRREATLRSAFAHDGQFEDQYLWAIVKGLDRT